MKVTINTRLFKVVLLIIPLVMTLSGIQFTQTTGYGGLLDGDNCDDHIHDQIFIEAIDVIKQDGYTSYANKLTEYKNQVCDGLRAVDKKDDKHSTYSGWHFWDPTENSAGTLALEAIQDNWDEAMYDYACASDTAMVTSSYRKIGRAAHFIGDMTVPHHTNGASKISWPTFDDLDGDLSNGHLYYEQYAEMRVDDLPTMSFGTPIKVSTVNYYSSIDNEQGFGAYAASISHGYYKYVNGIDGLNGEDSIKNNYGFTFNKMISLAVRLTAGFLIYYFQQADAAPVPDGCGGGSGDPGDGGGGGGGGGGLPIYICHDILCQIM